MPKENQFELSIPKLLTRQAIDIMMIGYILGYRHISVLKILQVKAAIKEFLTDLNISEDEYPLDVAVMRFYRAWEDFKAFPDWAGGRKWCSIQKNKQNDKSTKKRDDSTIQ